MVFVDLSRPRVSFKKRIMRSRHFANHHVGITSVTTSMNNLLKNIEFEVVTALGKPTKRGMRSLSSQKWKKNYVDPGPLGLTFFSIPYLMRRTSPFS